MRFGRGLDNRKLKAAGYRYRYTTRETVIKLREHQRLAPILRDQQGAYRYEREVEEFLRWSPSVQGGDAVADSPRTRRQPPFRPRVQSPPERPEPAAPSAAPPPTAEYDELEEDEVIGMLGALEPEDLEALRRYEQAARARPRVIRSIDAVLTAQAAARGHSATGGAPPPA
jgi:UDP-glucose 4-epimerase